MKKLLEESALIQGPAGSIEARYTSGSDSVARIAVICHPHPLYGGTMDNKVVHYTSRAFTQLGVAHVRFNFRGVGRSQGVHDNARGEQDDCRAVIEWLKARHPDTPLILAGFSFGSYVAAAVAARDTPNRLISIAPPVNLYDFPSLGIDCPWLVVMGDADEVVPSEQVKDWLEYTDQSIDARWMQQASHFFHGRLPELAEHITHWLQA